MSFWDQVKEKTGAAPVKLKMIFVENTIENLYLRLGSRGYDLGRAGSSLAKDGEVQALFKEIGAKKKEYEELRENFREIWQEEARELKASLQKGGGALEQVQIAADSPVRGQKVKDLDLPREVLLGPVRRGRELVIPHGETELREGDRIALMGTRKDVTAAKKYLRGKG